jgi:uncharacterized RDD family membrane protein YckC
MKKQLINRILAWIVDFVIIVFYAFLLFIVTQLFFEFSKGEINPYLGQLIGFLTLTLPVVAYSYLTERSKWKATIGKRLFNLTVDKNELKTTKSVLLRNVLKYLPWELAHTGVHWIIYFESVDKEVPIWTWTILIIPQVIVFFYFVSIIFSKGQDSIYDRISGTRLKLKLT